MKRGRGASLVRPGVLCVVLSLAALVSLALTACRADDVLIGIDQTGVSASAGDAGAADTSNGTVAMPDAGQGSHIGSPCIADGGGPDGAGCGEGGYESPDGARDAAEPH